MMSRTKIGLYLLIGHIFISVMSVKLQKIHNYSTLMKIVNNITESCHIRDKSSILIAGEFSANEIEELTLSNRSVLTLNHFNLEGYKNVHNTIQALVISPNSTDDLDRLLQQVKNSSMWNNLRYNIILSRIVSSNGCDNALNYLLAAWRGDLLNSIFLCALTDNSIKVYTYNPYTDYAPKQWSFTKKVKDNHDYWYLYSTDYFSTTTTCDILFYDKTRQLNGYSGIKIVSFISPRTQTTGSNYNFKDHVKKQFDNNIINALGEILNVTLKFENSNEYGAFDQKGNPIGLDKRLAHDHLDLIFDHRFLEYTNGLVQSTFTLGESGISFLSHHRSNLSIFVQIMCYFKLIVIIFTLIILGLTVAVLKFSIEESFDTAALEVFRLFLNGPLLKVPTNISPRIYMFTILMFVFIMQNILQSKILSFITVPRPDNLNTFADLDKHQEYKIYCKHGYDYLLPSSLKSRAIVLYSFGELFNNRQAVFIWEDMINIGIANERHLHHSTEVMSKHYIVHRTRRSWPLIHRVNEIYMYLFESGTTDHHRKLAEYFITHNHADDHNYNDSQHGALSIENLKFAFQILIFGFACSLISFLIEIKFWKCFFLFSKPPIKNLNIFK